MHTFRNLHKGGVREGKGGVREGVVREGKGGVREGGVREGVEACFPAEAIAESGHANINDPNPCGTAAEKHVRQFTQVFTCVSRRRNKADLPHGGGAPEAQHIECLIHRACKSV